MRCSSLATDVPVARHLRAAALAAIAAVAVLSASAVSARPSDKQGSQLRVAELARGLEAPWSVAFLPDGRALITERPGRLRLLRAGGLAAVPVATLRVGAQGEAGLLGIALDPGYPKRSFAYLYYTAPGGANRVSRFRLVSAGAAGLRLANEKVLLDGIPGAGIHDGGRIAFGPDEMLYVGTGDSGRPELAARRMSLAGKILRLRPDGGIPGSNPFPRSPVWSYGHRNVQGLAWDGRGRMYASEHGPTGEFGLCCHDEINLIERGGFYGWPLKAGRATAARPGEIRVSGLPRAIPPVAESDGATWAPSGIAFLGRSLYVANLRGEQVRRFDLDRRRPGGVVRQSVVLQGRGRIRDVVRGRRGCLYVLTSNRDGRGDPRAGDDKLLRLCP